MMPADARMKMAPGQLPALALSVRDEISQGEHVALPSPHAALRHACPLVLEAMVGPLALFYLVLVTAGFKGALIAALAWSYVALARRFRRGERVSTLLVLGTVLLTVRTVVAFVTGSSFLYFAQPTVGMVVTSLVLVGSAVLGRPLTQRFAHDFCPIRPRASRETRCPSVLRADFPALGDRAHAQRRHCVLAPPGVFASCVRPGANGSHLGTHRNGDLLLDHSLLGGDATRWNHRGMGPKSCEATSSPRMSVDRTRTL